MSAKLSPYRLRKARDVFRYFNIFNAISWNLLVGVIITLFALRLGASSTYIGLLSASFYLALFFLPLGKILAKRFSIIKIYSFAWAARSICMVLAAAAPFLDYFGRRDLALLFILAGVYAFHFFRGIGMIGNNPVLNLLATGPDRGSYLTQIQIVNGAIGMFGSFAIAMILGIEPPIFIFSILLGAGVITGVISGHAIKKVPEPPFEEDSREKLVDVFKDAFSNNSLRRFISILFLVAIVSGVTRTFAVVYAREVFGHNDGLVSLYSVFGGLGYLMIGMIIKFLVDRIGAKPIFVVCMIMGLVSLFPVVIFPQSIIGNMTGSILFLVFLFFMLNFGFLGSEGIAQTYFMAMVPAEKMLNLGIVYFFCFGAAGAAGSFLAGLLLDFLYFIGLSHFISFKILFASQIALAITAIILQRGLKSLGSMSLKGALDVIFSFRDLRAISLIEKLDRSIDSKEEESILVELYDTPSLLSVKSLLERVRSPRLSTRLEAIRAFEKMHALSENAEKAIIENISGNLFTTAYISARILGKHGCKSAIPLLREYAASADYMLAGEAMVALAKMKDEEFRNEIENIILFSENPRLKIMGAEALGIFRCADSLIVLINILRTAQPHIFLRDEAVLSMSAILGTQRQFYPVLVRFVADSSLVVTLGIDEADAAVEFCNAALNGRKKSADRVPPEISSLVATFHNAVTEYMMNKNGEEFSKWITQLPNENIKDAEIVKSVFSQAVLEEELRNYNCLRLLIVNWAACELRMLVSRKHF